MEREICGVEVKQVLVKIERLRESWLGKIRKREEKKIKSEQSTPIVERVIESSGLTEESWEETGVFSNCTLIAPTHLPPVPSANFFVLTVKTNFDVHFKLSVAISASF